MKPAEATRRRELENAGHRAQPTLHGHSQVSTVGMRAANMRNSMEKKRKPELLRTFLASLPMPR